MPPEAQVIYKFGDCLLNPVERRLLRDGTAVPLPPKVFDTLLFLLECRSSLISKEEFLNRIWPDSSVEEVALAHCISHLRKALGDATEGRRFIETVPKRGYRFIADVEVAKTGTDNRPPLVRIAVLPFENLGGDPDREYLANGFTEETISALGQIDPDRLSVIGRTTMMTYKSTTKTVLEISQELNADYLVESSFRLEGKQIRILSRLVRGRDEVQLWSSAFDDEANSMLQFQSELGTAIASRVRLQLSPERFMVALIRRQTRSPEAFDQYLRGRYFWNQLLPATTRRAVQFYSRAIELDPAYALAWSGLADASAASPINGDVPTFEVSPRARAAAAQAVASEPDLAEAQTSLGMVSFFLDWNWTAAERSFRKAVLLDPSYCLAHRTLGILLSHSLRHEEAKTTIAKARLLEPFDAAHHALSAQVAFNAGEYPSALRFARQAIVLNPKFWIGYLQLAQALTQTGNSVMALDALQTAEQLCGGNTKVPALRGYILARSGRTQEAQQVLAALEGLSQERYVPPYSLALVCAGLGERDSTFQWLENALEVHDVHAIFLPVDPKWDGFRNDAAFRFISGRCNFQADNPGLAGASSRPARSP